MSEPVKQVELVQEEYKEKLSINMTIIFKAYLQPNSVTEYSQWMTNDVSQEDISISTDKGNINVTELFVDIPSFIKFVNKVSYAYGSTNSQPNNVAESDAVQQRLGGLILRYRYGAKIKLFQNPDGPIEEETPSGMSININAEKIGEKPSDNMVIEQQQVTIELEDMDISSFKQWSKGLVVEDAEKIVGYDMLEETAMSLERLSARAATSPDISIADLMAAYNPRKDPELKSAMQSAVTMSRIKPAGGSMLEQMRREIEKQGVSIRSSDSQADMLAKLGNAANKTQELNKAYAEQQSRIDDINNRNREIDNQNAVAQQQAANANAQTQVDTYNKNRQIRENNRMGREEVRENLVRNIEKSFKENKQETKEALNIQNKVEYERQTAIIDQEIQQLEADIAMIEYFTQNGSVNTSSNLDQMQSIAKQAVEAYNPSNPSTIPTTVVQNELNRVAATYPDFNQNRQLYTNVINYLVSNIKMPTDATLLVKAKQDYHALITQYIQNEKIKLNQQTQQYASRANELPKLRATLTDRLNKKQQLDTKIMDIGKETDWNFQGNTLGRLARPVAALEDPKARKNTIEDVKSTAESVVNTVKDITTNRLGGKLELYRKRWIR